MRPPRWFGRPAAVGAVFVASALAFGVRSAPAEDGSRELGVVDDAYFREHVRPLLERRCAECHGSAVRRPKGGLRLDSRAALLRGGHEGPAFDADDPKASLLLRAIRGEELGLEMPPDERLDRAEIEVLERWIAGGAPWPIDDTGHAASPEDARFFEERVRPVLAEACFGCHGPQLAEVEGAFRMAGRAGLLRGGHRGAAVVPHDAESSPLVRALRYEDRHLRMPPSGPLPAEVVDDIARWVALGAPWPDYDGPSLDEFESHGGIDIGRARATWPYSPLVRPDVPDVPGARTAIDAFLGVALADAGIVANGAATWRELVRRAHVDLHGLPPTALDFERWLADERPDRFERLVDELLASRRFAERLARVWLDVVRFSETNGYERDAVKPYSWRYRDWVVESFHADKRFDRFLAEQLAGDEMDPHDPQALAATGFLRIGAWDDEPDDPVEARHDERDDILRTVGEGFLGLTIGCARCHDHLFDPVRQEDYYAFSAFFAGLLPYELPEHRPGSAVLRMADEGPDALARWDAARLARVADVERELRARQRQKNDTSDRTRTPLRLLALEAEKLAKEFAGEETWYLAAREVGPTPPPTHVLVRGRAASPGAEVEPRFLPVLAAGDAGAVPAEVLPHPASGSSGRRLALAQWIASAENPLTARVFVNRVWQLLFAVGIVETANDFGSQGSGATHPELLDWLASEFIAGEFRVKALVRTVMLSDAYQRSSQAANRDALEVDPANRLLWRQRLRRLTAEGLHDAMLLASGELLDGPPPEGGSYFPVLGRAVLAGMSRPGEGWGRSDEAERNRRALYARQKRGVQTALASVFDAANPSLPAGSRLETTTATQALVLWNGEFTAQRAAATAERVLAEAGADASHAVLVDALFARILGRAPTERERTACATYLAQQTRAFAEADRPIRMRPAVPGRLDLDLQRALEPADLFTAVPTGFEARLGVWGDAYNGTLAPDRDHGPALLLAGQPRAFEGVRARVTPEAGCEQVGIVLRARSTPTHLIGIELRLEPERETVTLVQRTADLTRPLRMIERSFVPGEAIAIEIRLVGAAVFVALDGVDVPDLGVDSCRVPPVGTIAFTVFGDGATVEGLEVAGGGGWYELRSTLAVTPTTRDRDAHRSAVESLAQVLFNTNEFVYVD